MAANISAGSQNRSTGRAFVLCALLLTLVLALLFFRSFQPSQVPFSNDGPLGGMVAQQNRMPGIMKGLWQDLNWIGTPGPSPSPTIGTALRFVTTPLGFSKWFYPYSLFILGLSAWFCFRQLRFSPLACILGGLAAALSSHFLSTACWGVASQTICVGMSFVAVGLLANTTASNANPPTPRPLRQSLLPWVRVILAGMAVGMGVLEGYDIGAIFSLYVAAFVVYQAWVTSEGTPARKVFWGAIRGAVVALFAGLIAAHALFVLIGTQIKGVAGTEQTPEAKAARWDFSTQWSFPKGELLRVVIPGLFGYRMDTPKDMGMLRNWFEGGVYWGKVGETPGWSDNHKDPEWVRTHGAGSPRFSGGGEYAGVLVVVGALWAVLQSLRKKDSVFSLMQRKFIWFWAIAAFVSLLFAFGRYAPFYRFIYMLPYFSTIRNPAKFTHPFNWSLVILFAYGIHGLCRRYLNTGAGVTLAPSEGERAGVRGPQSTSGEDNRSPQSLPKGKGGKRSGSLPAGSLSPSDGERTRVRGPQSTVRAKGLSSHLKSWWPKANSFDKKWTIGSLIAVSLSLLGLLIYASSKPGLEQHLREVGYADPAFAAQIAAFSIREVGLFIVFLVLALGLFILVLSGRFSGPGTRWGILLGALLVIDLARANLPWIIYWDYKEKYALNPVVESLRDKPYEHRVAGLPFRPPRELSLLNDVYRIEWAQHHFQYYNIQSLDVIQMPRMPVDYVAFETAMQFDGRTNTLHRLGRRWQLTNTRYLLGAAGFLEVLNKEIDPVQHRFQIVRRFDLVPKPGETEVRAYDQLMAVANTNGQYAIFSFTGALPRAKLYTNWQVATNDQTALNELRTAALAPDELEILKQVGTSPAGTNDLLTLKKLSSPGFDPEKTVLLASPLPGQSSVATTNTPAAGTVDFISYAPKRIELQTKADAPSVLLLNDKYDPDWKVTLDGKPQTLLRCNYVMRGVEVPRGEHRIEFRFEPPITGLYVSLAAIALGLALIGFLAVFRSPSSFSSSS